MANIRLFFRSVEQWPGVAAESMNHYDGGRVLLLHPRLDAHARSRPYHTTSRMAQPLAGW